MPQIWTRWLQVKRIRSGTPDHNPIPTTAHKTPLSEHQPKAPLSDAIAVSWTFTLEKTTTWAVNVPQWTLARVKTSNLRIDYKPVASLSSVQVITASLPCLEYAHSYSILGLISAHLRIISRWFSSLVVTPGRRPLPLGGHAGVCLAGKTLTCVEHHRIARPIIPLP